MGKCAQMVVGPAGSGKSTYCSAIQKHCENMHRTVHVVNLDPAAESLSYDASVDVRELVSLEDVVGELNCGPNGGLVYCMEFLQENMEWLEEAVGSYEDDYLIIDCPGQIELYTHLPVMKNTVMALQQWGYRVCTVYLLDSTFVTDTARFFSGMLACLSAMMRLEVTHVNVFSKVDLLRRSGKMELLDRILEPQIEDLLDTLASETGQGLAKLNSAIGHLVEEYGMVSFVPLDVCSEDSLNEVLTLVDGAVQYGEDLEPLEPDDGLRERDDESEPFAASWGGAWDG